MRKSLLTIIRPAGVAGLSLALIAGLLFAAGCGVNSEVGDGGTVSTTEPSTVPGGGTRGQDAVMRC